MKKAQRKKSASRKTAKPGQQTSAGKKAQSKKNLRRKTAKPGQQTSAGKKKPSRKTAKPGQQTSAGKKNPSRKSAKSGKTAIAPPKALKRAFFHKKFGDKRADPYYWLKNRGAPEVLRYLKEENKYGQSKLKPLKKLKTELFEEMKSRLTEKENQEPTAMGAYFYYKTWKKRNPYPIHKRRKKSGGREEIILDENRLAVKHSYLDVANVSVSPSHEILAYALDSQGREFYNIYFKRLKTGRRLPRFISSATLDFVWANDNQTVFFTRQDKQTLRVFQVWRFDIKTGREELVFEEKDVKFSVYLNKTLCASWITLLSHSSQTSEFHYLPASRPKGRFALFCKRKPKHEYHLHYGDGVFYILSNKDGAFNFKLMKAPVEKKSQSSKPGDYPASLWEELIPHRPETFIENYEVFKNFIALETRSQGRTEIEIFDQKKQVSHKVSFADKVRFVSLGENKEYNSPSVRLKFQSPTQPEIVYDYFPGRKKLSFKSQRTVKGGFDSKNYISRMEYAPSPDGSQTPVSIVHKKGLRPAPSTPLLLYGYGSYGISVDPMFSSALLSLLDRGFIYAIAHVRGGSEKGRKWYDEGRLLNKKNTFSDFIACARHLIKRPYTSSSHLYIMGASAGGLLIGAVLNRQPELFRAVIASVPFVDCLTTMLDESIPLSTGEYEEWGNPHNKIYYDCVKSYSPYDNIKKTKYPHILIQAGYHDPRVQYWEPAKWTAKLRDSKIGRELVLLLTNMKSGHFGSTGRLERLKILSLYYAFLIGIEKGLID